MVVSPRDDAVLDAEYEQVGPRIDYPITIDSAGIYYIWVHGMGLSDEASIHVGLNGSPLFSSDRIFQFGPTGRRYYWRLPWPVRDATWSRRSLDRVSAYIEFRETGTHVLNVWMRSSDMAFDKILVTPEDSFRPRGAGPGPSSLETPQYRPPTFSRSSGLFHQATVVSISADSGAETISFTTDGSDPRTSESSATYGAPIEVKESLTLRAVAMGSGGSTSHPNALHLRRIACEPTKIMPLGDSITLGIYGPLEVGPISGSLGGYRAPLYSKLTDSGYAVDFVGGLSDGKDLAPPVDPDHQGRDGWTAEEIANAVYDFLRQDPPDIVLLHAGTNGMTPDVTALDRILSEIDRFEVDFDRPVHVVLAQVINRSRPHEDTTSYNQNLAELAETRAASGDLVSLVDMESALSYPDQLYDDLHPNDEGYARMSEVWYEALAPMLTRCDSPIGSVSEYTRVPALASGTQPEGS